MLDFVFLGCVRFRFRRLLSQFRVSNEAKTDEFNSSYTQTIDDRMTMEATREAKIEMKGY